MPNLLSRLRYAPSEMSLPVVCGVLWWLYYDYTYDLSIELDTERENMECLLGFAIVSTVVTWNNVRKRHNPWPVYPRISLVSGRDVHLPIRYHPSRSHFHSPGCFLGLLFVCGVLWWLYYDYTYDLSIELDTERENMECLLGFAIVSTVVTAVLLVLIFVLRKRIKLTVELFRVINKAIGSSPFLLFQPLWTFAILIFFWVLWVAVLLSLGTAGAAQVIEGGQVEYKPLSGIRYMWWYHLIGLIWTSEFILACQQMTTAGAVATCYFNRNKNDPPDRPILSSLSVLFCYHLGTVVKGSFVITVVRIPRTVLVYMCNALKEKQRSVWSRYVFKCCFCCFWCLDRCLRHLNQNAYTTTAINATDFCASAKDALKLLSKNSSHFTSVNRFGDFIIFLGKVLVVCFTVFGGLMAFNYNRALQVWAIPLLLVAFLAYLVAHSFLSVFETVLDALFLCFTVDLETNDGSSEKPYFMDQEFLSFVTRINKLNDPRAQKDKNSLRKEEGTELRPIVRPTVRPTVR
nr:choline transporter-like protein 3 [Equus asinus]